MDYNSGINLFKLIIFISEKFWTKQKKETMSCIIVLLGNTLRFVN